MRAEMSRPLQTPLSKALRAAAYGRLCISVSGLRNRSKREPGPRVDSLEGLSVLGVDKLTIYEQFVLVHWNPPFAP